jgi:hypothetical protein
MKALTAIAVAAAVFAASVPAQAASKNTATVQREASCKADAAKKFSAIHFLKRRDFVNNCMGRSAHAKATLPMKKAQPTTTGQSVK